MKVCVIGPFISAGIADLLDAVHAEDLKRYPATRGSNVVSLVRALIAEGVETEVITLDPAAERPVVFQGEGLRYTLLPSRRNRQLRDVYAYERRFLRDAISRSEADVIHIQWTYQYALGALDSGRRATLITVHDRAASLLRWLTWQYAPQYLMTRYVYRKGRHFTAASPYLAEYVRRFTRRPVWVVPNCTGVQWSASAAEPSDPKVDGVFRICSALSSEKYKNAPGALRAFGRVRRSLPGARYVLIGPGLEPGGAVARWAADHGLDAGVEFRGEIPHENVLREFAASHVIFHASREEGFGLTLIEGMTLNRVVVAGSRTGACPWVLDGGKAGILADVASPEESAAALMRIYENWDWAMGIAREGHRMAKDRFSPQVVARRFIGIYGEVARDAAIAAG